MVPRSASLWNRPTLWLRLGVRTHVDVYYRYFEYPRCHSFRSHARQCRILAGSIRRSRLRDLYWGVSRNLVNSSFEPPRSWSTSWSLERVITSTVVENGVSILIRSCSTSLYLPLTSPTTTEPFLKHSQTV